MPAAADKKTTLPGEGVLLGLKPRTTYLPSQQIKHWSERIRDASLFSARTTRRSYLDAIKEQLASIARRDQIPLVGEKKLKATLASLGYTPQAGFPGDMAHYHGRTIPPAIPGSMTDLSSTRRIQLVIDTNVKQARSMGQIATSENPVFLMANPAWHLTRTGARAKPRKDWQQRWKDAGDSVSWVGACKTAMVALKTSPIWKALGDGAGGWRDNVGSPYPPFAFGSGLAWVNVGRRQWKRFCEKEGVPDGLGDIDARAKSLKSEQEAMGGEGSFGTAAVRRDGWTPSSEPPRPAFVADLSKVQPALSSIGAADARIDRAVTAISMCLASVREADNGAKNDLAAFPNVDGTGVLKRIADARTGLESALANVEGAKASSAALPGRINGLAKPVDRAGQTAFDAQIAACVAEAERLASGAESLVNDARSRMNEALAARKEIPGLVLAWKISECGKMVDAARPAVAALDGDDYEKMLGEAKKAVADHKAEMKRLGKTAA